MAFSEETKEKARKNAGYTCECTRKCEHHLGGRCGTYLAAGTWHAHHKTPLAAGGSDALSNCEALCIPCHEKTGTYRV
jgi:5-methylcytosine-specific restriction endonuclease McrA